jgi:2-keto-3-deoxy-L-rhamnonate aldolase RhmA
MNAIKEAIKSGRTVVGTTAGPNVDVSILADAGYDFLLFDTQHSAWEIKQLQPSIQAMRGKQAAPLVRVAANQAYQICGGLPNLLCRNSGRSLEKTPRRPDS